ncbi:MAG: hypothetical protein H0V66_15160 [Bdellovibrionales bacterium]|nr:hypothetical protein [Bdellovibrionales bacterium]
MKNLSRFLATFMVMVFFSQSVAFAVNPSEAALHSQEGQMALKRITRMVNSHLQGLNQKQLDKFAYGTYLLAVRTRNSLARLSEKAFAKKLRQASANIKAESQIDHFESEEMISEDENQVVEFLGTKKQISENERSHLASQINSLSRNKLLNEVEAALHMIDGKQSETGKMKALSKSEFLSRLSAEEFRAPASDSMMGTILGILLGIVVVGVIVIGVVAIISLGPVVGLIIVGAVCVGLVAAGVVAVVKAFQNS